MKGSQMHDAHREMHTFCTLRSFLWDFISEENELRDPVFV